MKLNLFLLIFLMLTHQNLFSQDMSLYMPEKFITDYSKTFKSEQKKDFKTKIEDAIKVHGVTEKDKSVIRDLSIRRPEDDINKLPKDPQSNEYKASMDRQVFEFRKNKILEISNYVDEITDKISLDELKSYIKKNITNQYSLEIINEGLKEYFPDYQLYSGQTLSSQAKGYESLSPSLGIRYAKSITNGMKNYLSFNVNVFLNGRNGKQDDTSAAFLNVINSGETARGEFGLKLGIDIAGAPCFIQSGVGVERFGNVFLEESILSPSLALLFNVRSALWIGGYTDPVKLLLGINWDYTMTPGYEGDTTSIGYFFNKKNSVTGIFGITLNNTLQFSFSGVLTSGVNNIGKFSLKNMSLNIGTIVDIKKVLD